MCDARNIVHNTQFSKCNPTRYIYLTGGVIIGIIYQQEKMRSGRKYMSRFTVLFALLVAATTVRVTATCTFIIIALASNTFSQDMFAPAVNYAAGNGPHSILLIDLNDDGYNDVATTNVDSDDVSILLGNGDGTFQSAVSYDVENGPLAIFAIDLNGDGYNDLATANYGDNSISILLGNGDGTFQSAVRYVTVSNPHDVFAIDINGDGYNDLATANYGTDNVSILLGNGDGTLQDAVYYNAGSHPHSVISIDFDGDGNYDLALTNHASNNVSILLGNGDGTFNSAVHYPAGTNPNSVTSIDLSDDGNYDLATANRGQNNVSILLGNGDGTFQSAVGYAVGTGPMSVVSIDLDGDGTSDLATANWDSDDVSILFGNGDGTFQSAVSYAVGIGLTSVFSNDVDGDNDNDLVTANHATDDISVLLNLTNDYAGPVWHVATGGDDVTGDGSEANPFATIQAGIDAAVDSDTVLVELGLYNENIDFLGRSIVVASSYIATGDSAAIANTIIRGDGTFSVVTFSGNEDETTRLIGFSITNGIGQPASTDNYFGGGIAIPENATSSPTISNNYIYGNHVTKHSGCCGSSGAIGIVNATGVGKIVIEHNSIFDNSAYMHGAAIYVQGRANVHIADNVFYHNYVENQIDYSSVIELYSTISSSVTNNSVMNNPVTALLLRSPLTASVSDNLVVGNHNDVSGTGGIYFFGVNLSTASVINNSFYSNASNVNVVLPGFEETIYTNANGTTCDQYNNIFVDPVLCDTSQYNLGVDYASPCIGAGSDGGVIGAVGVGCMEDLDEDGTPDHIDNCPNTFNPNQVDTDGDSVGDACDACPGYDDTLDVDADGVPDGCDICADSDDLVDTDGDGIPDGCDVCAGYDDLADTDSDTVPDGCDVCEGHDDAVDVDEDSIPDGCDNCPTEPNTDQADTDRDSFADACDNCPNQANIEQTDVDADGTGDACDNCEFMANTDQADSDLDGVGDFCDNCPDDPNGLQEDTDNNGTGDACCCTGRVGDANQSGDDEPTIGDVSILIDNLFITGVPLPCLFEADINQSGGDHVTNENVTIGDISFLIDYLFITGPSLGLVECL